MRIDFTLVHVKVECDADLPEVADAHNGFGRRFNPAQRREQQRRKHADDCKDHQ